MSPCNNAILNFTAITTYIAKLNLLPYNSWLYDIIITCCYTFLCWLKQGFEIYDMINHILLRQQMSQNMTAQIIYDWVIGIKAVVKLKYQLVIVKCLLQSSHCMAII